MRHRNALVPGLEHLAVLSDDTGVIQHATESVPNRATGYCTDDVARAFMVVLARLQSAPRDELAARLASTYLSFLESAQLEDGRFHNFMNYGRAWLDEVGTQDSCGRAMWALGYGMRYAPAHSWRRLCTTLFERGLGAIDDYDFVHPRAYTLIGLSHALAVRKEPRYAAAARYLAGALVTSYERERRDDWKWFAPVMTYDNARLPEAMIRSAAALAEAQFGEIGLETLNFYEGVTLDSGMFVPIGNNGWYPRGGARAVYAQQPLEAAALVDAELAALDATGDPAHFANAELGLAWFYGKNSRAETMAHGGGCYDGLEEDGVNRNMGAESTLALLAAAYAVGSLRARSASNVRLAPLRSMSIRSG
ncbi:MAG: hypothetical protein WCD38_04260 [Candidatus Tumulicola sp.]